MEILLNSILIWISNSFFLRTTKKTVKGEERSLIKTSKQTFSWFLFSIKYKKNIFFCFSMYVIYKLFLFEQHKVIFETSGLNVMLRIIRTILLTSISQTSFCNAQARTDFVHQKNFQNFYWNQPLLSISKTELPFLQTTEFWILQNQSKSRKLRTEIPSKKVGSTLLFNAFKKLFGNSYWKIRL